MVFPDALLDSLKTAVHITVLTGAGISAESGVPTFRQAQTGLWAQYDPHELATPTAFRRNAKLVWDWYAWRRELVGQAQPNPGHLALVELAGRAPNFTLVTQNVDNLHQRAGSQGVIELHGNIGRIKCAGDGRIITTWQEQQEQDETPPRCPDCNQYLRPDVVWFGENLPHSALEQAMLAARHCDLFFSIGTSALVQPAASLPLLAVENGAILVEINPDQTPLTRFADFALHGPAGELLPALIAAAWPNQP
jgi:NAD-dependent deacetylase